MRDSLPKQLNLTDTYNSWQPESSRSCSPRPCCGNCVNGSNLSSDGWGRGGLWWWGGLWWTPFTSSGASQRTETELQSLISLSARICVHVDAKTVNTLLTYVNTQIVDTQTQPIIYTHTNNNTQTSKQTRKGIEEQMW